MGVFELLGFSIAVLGTGCFIAALFIFAGFGAYVAVKYFNRGVEVFEQDQRDGRMVDEVMRRAQ